MRGPNHLENFKVELIKKLGVKRITEKSFLRVYELEYSSDDYYENYYRKAKISDNPQTESFEKNGTQYDLFGTLEYWVDRRGYIAGYDRNSTFEGIGTVNLLHIEDRAGKLLSIVEVDDNRTNVFIFDENGEPCHEISYKDGQFYSCMGPDHFEDVQEIIEAEEGIVEKTYYENGLLKSITFGYDKSHAECITYFSYEYAEDL